MIAFLVHRNVPAYDGGGARVVPGIGLATFGNVIAENGSGQVRRAMT